MSTTDPAQALRELTPRHSFFVGIDSDGCAFDTMEIKHKECFIPNIISLLGPPAGLQVRPRGRRSSSTSTPSGAASTAGRPC